MGRLLAATTQPSGSIANGFARSYSIPEIPEIFIEALAIGFRGPRAPQNTEPEQAALRYSKAALTTTSVSPPRTSLPWVVRHSKYTYLPSVGGMSITTP